VTSAWAAALALVVAALLVVAGRGTSRARLAAIAPARRVRRLVPRLPIGAVVAAAGAAGWSLGGPVAALALALYTAAGARIVRDRRRARAGDAALQAALDAVAGLADDLRAGQLPATALAGAAEAAGPALDETSRAALWLAANQAGDGHSAAPALRSVTGAGISGVFARLASIWVLADSGVPLAALLDRLDSELRAQRRAAQKAASQLAAARATAGLLSALPLLGLLLGQVLGASPVRVLTGTVAGGVCAVAAMALHAGGRRGSSGSP
jgi:tight adherence protein B